MDIQAQVKKLSVQDGDIIVVSVNPELGTNVVIDSEGMKKIINEAVGDRKVGFIGLIGCDAHLLTPYMVKEKRGDIERQIHFSSYDEVVKYLSE